MCNEKEFEMELLRRMAKDYIKATKKDKTKIISQYSAMTGIKRATAQKRFKRYISGSSPKGSTSFRGRPKRYTKAHEEIVQCAWEHLGCICAERLHPCLSETIEELVKDGLLRGYSLKTLSEAKEASLSTLKRMIQRFPKPLTSRNTHKGNTMIYRQVPVDANFGSNAHKGPGYVEVDFVEHNGGNSSGRFAITGVYTDLSTQWTVRGCGWGKNLESIRQIDEIVHKRIPFKVIHYHPDNDKSILRVLFERVRQTGAHLSRSRPYKKNDNAHVEQKGGDRVRRLVGYFRYETEEEVGLLNAIYEVADLLENFFVPTIKLKQKIVDERGQVVKRVYERAKTPYQRVLESSEVPEEVKDRLRATKEGLSLVKLKRRLDELVGMLLAEKIGLKPKRFHGQNNALTEPHFTDIHF